MKTPPFFLPVLTAALWLPALSLAQTVTSGLPGFISYQGRVLNSAGDLVGVGTPVNREVTFRIWNHPSNTQAANLIYSETQTVTIADGEFSVLVGQGVATDGTTFSYPEVDKGPPVFSISNAFGGSDRFLGVTVDDDTDAADNEISPRQQIVSAAFAFRAKYAENLGTNGTALTVVDGGNIGVGTDKPAARFTIAGANSGTTSATTPQLLITDSAEPEERLRIGVDNQGNGAGFLQSYREGTGTQKLLLNPMGGFVGINKNDPTTNLDVFGVIRADNTKTGAPAVGDNGGQGQRLVFWPGSASTVPYGMGIDGSTLWHAVPVNSMHKWYEGTTEKMRLEKSNLGIGTTAPAGRLHIAETTGTLPNFDAGTVILDHENTGGASSVVFRSKVNRNSDFGYIMYQDTDTIGGSGEKAVLTIGVSNDPDDHIALLPAGNVGIGTSTPTLARLQVMGAGPVQGMVGGLMNGSPYVAGSILTGSIWGGWSSPVSIYGSGTIWAGAAVVASSDERIKNIKGQSNSASDLQTLMKVEVTDYFYKDQVTRGRMPQKKVIAQQLEKVYPQAVGRQTEVVPDIFKPTVFEAGWIRLATDLKVGERVRLLTGAHDGVHQVLEVRSDMFRTTFSPPVLTATGSGVAPVKVFVYGREVNDFRTVDYEAVAMLNVSATQELKKDADLKVKALIDENNLLKTRLADLEARDAERNGRLSELESNDKARQSRLEAIEALLQSAGKTAASQAGQ